MKHIAFIVLATALFWGCKKSGKDHKEGLVDRWEIRESEGGVAGIIKYKPGNGTIYEFNSDNSFVYYQSGNLSQSGTYDWQPISGNDRYKISLHTNVRDVSHEITLKGDTLVFLSNVPCCDIPSVTYVRIGW